MQTAGWGFPGRKSEAPATAWSTLLKPTGSGRAGEEVEEGDGDG